MNRVVLIVVVGLLGAAGERGGLSAQEPRADTARGDRVLSEHFQRQVRQIGQSSLADIKTRADWEKQQPELRRQFLDMLGLWPLPPRTDLKATSTGKLDGGTFTVEKIHFQSRPGLYVTGNLYVPKKLNGPAPGILYVCGHGNTVLDKVSYGSKIGYQYHPAWFADHGYVCLILDTLQLGEIEGIHHGLYRYNLWWWQARGYTPAGVECWNAMRALDYLQSRKEVDPKRLGVTGRSGGGATSWWVAAADERVQCAVPVAGLADLQSHVVEGLVPRLRTGVINGHCDCMYFVNTYRWDFDKVIALCAPRAVLLGNSDVDDIFPVPGYQRPAANAKRIYELLGAGDRFDLLETKGPHTDTDDLRRGAFAWMNRWLKDDRKPVELPTYPKFTPQQLKVFERLPTDEINTRVHESFVPLVKHAVPSDARAWEQMRTRLLGELQDKVFRGWPTQPAKLAVQRAGDVTDKDLRVRAYDFVSEEGVPLRLWITTLGKNAPKKLIVVPHQEAEWTAFTQALGAPFQELLQLATAPASSADLRKKISESLAKESAALVAVAVRGIGPTRWSDKDAQGNAAPQQVRRRFGLLGQTLEGQRVWDVRRALQALGTLDEFARLPITLQAQGDMAVVSLYAAVFTPGVTRLELRHPPASHEQGPMFLNVLRVLDVPQAVALVFPRTVVLRVRSTEVGSWDWPMQLQRRLGATFLNLSSEEE